MENIDDVAPPSKKRNAGVELSRDNPYHNFDDENSDDEPKTFKKASDEVLATRRIVKVRRSKNNQTTSNPFAGISLVPSMPSETEETATGGKESDKNIPPESKAEEGGTACAGEETDINKSSECKAEEEIDVNKSSESKAEEETDVNKSSESKAEGETTMNKSSESKAEEESKAEKEEESKAEKEEESKAEKEEAVAENKEKDYNGVAGESNGTHDEKALEAKLDCVSESVVNDGEKISPGKNKAEGTTPLSTFQHLSSTQNAFTGFSGTGFSTSSFSFTSLTKEGNNGDKPTEGNGFPSMQETPVETGEENEKVAFSADAALYEFLAGSWKERGKGELKLNLSVDDGGKARLLMRARGNYRLILNANLYSEMKLTNMDKRGVTFACVNSAGDVKDGLSTFALKFKDGSVVQEFKDAVVHQLAEVAAQKNE